MAYAVTYGSYTIPVPANYTTRYEPDVDRGTTRGRTTTLTFSFVLNSTTEAGYKTLRDAAITNLLKTEQNLTVLHGASTMISLSASELWLVSQPSLDESGGSEKSPVSARFTWAISFTELTVSLQSPGVGWVLTYQDDIQEQPNGLKTWVRSGKLQSTTVGASQRWDDLVAAEESAIKTPTGYQLTNTQRQVDQFDRDLSWSLQWDQRNILAAAIVSRAKDFRLNHAISRQGDTKRVVFSGSVEYPSTESAASSSADVWLEELKAYFEGHPQAAGGKLTDETLSVDEQKNRCTFSLTYEVSVTGEPDTQRFAETIIISTDFRRVDYDLLGPQAITFTQQVAWETVMITQSGSVETLLTLPASEVDSYTAPPAGIKKEWRRSMTVTPNQRVQTSSESWYTTTWIITYRASASDVQGELRKSRDGAPFGG